MESFTQGGSFRTCLVYPNTYYAGMSNLGFHKIYSIINSHPEFYCDRAFLPDKEILPLYAKGRRKLMALESERPVQEFDIVAFSVSYEMDFLNILKILELSGIPFKSEERGDQYPLIIAGGAAVSINPEIIAPFIDILFIGEGEINLRSFLDSFLQNQFQRQNRNNLFSQISTIPGIYIPSIMNTPPPIPTPSDLRPPTSDFPTDFQLLSVQTAHSVILSPDTEFADMFLIEISRGCPFSCGFCTLSLMNKPFRPAPLDEILKIVDMGLSLTRHFGLVGAAVASHPHIKEILNYINEKGGEVSFSSLRADVLNEEKLNLLFQAGHKTLTLAPETGSEKLRKKINKTLTDEKLYQTLKTALEVGFREFRLYLMIGLPHETDQDLLAGVEMINKIADLIRPIGGKLTVSVNPLIPKPHTPLQIYSINQEDEIKRKYEMLISPFYKSSWVSFKTENPRESRLQSFLCKGNRQDSEYLLKLYKKSFSQITASITKMKRKNS